MDNNTNITEMDMEIDEEKRNDVSVHDGSEHELEHETADSCGLVMEVDESVLDVSLKFHDYEGAESVPTVGKFRNMSTQTELNYTSASTQTDEILIVKKASMSTQTFTPSIKKQEFGVQVDSPSLVFDDIRGNDSKVLFYTGIPDGKTFDALYYEMEGGMKNQNEFGRPRILRLIDEFFMVLMRLRLGLLLEDLSDRFNISVSTCSLIFNKWVNYLDINLQFLIMWPSRENIDNTMPEQFKRKYPKCRVVIDCTEIKAETPSSLQLRSLLYSDYKSHMTYKSLVGISPSGIVTFVSDLYSGSTSDKQITRLSGLVDLCEEGDAIMVDKGFLISDLTTPKGIDLIIPPFKQRKRQFLPYEVEATKSIANLRIHVEREMERIKNFRILQGVMPITMASQSSKIWKICVRLTNLQPPLVLNNINE